jgi:hypothetical protein
MSSESSGCAFPLGNFALDVGILTLQLAHLPGLLQNHRNAPGTQETEKQITTREQERTTTENCPDR